MSTFDCYVKHAKLTYFKENITQLYMVPTFSRYPSGTILLGKSNLLEARAQIDDL